MFTVNDNHHNFWEWFYDLVGNYHDYKFFVSNILPPLEDNEVYFVSMSARKKYLTDEEREYYGLGRTEMYARQLVRSKERFDQAMVRLAVSQIYRITKTGMEIPRHARVCYVNINPCDAVTAVLDFNHATASMVRELTVGTMRGKNPSTGGFVRADRKLLNAFQTSMGTRTWLDIDADTDDFGVVKELEQELRFRSIENWVINTRSGWHVLVNRSHLNDANYQLHETVRKLDESVQPDGEVIFNSNGMIPMPGTYQAGHLVSIVGH